MHHGDLRLGDWQQPSAHPKLTEGDVHLWRVCIADGHETDYFREILTEDERIRAGEYYFEKDRRIFIISRGYLRIILADYLDASPEDLVFHVNRYGKPFLTEDIGKPLRFNLAHSGDWIVYAFAMGSDIGIDIEKIRALEDQDKIIHRFFSDSEKAAFAGISPSQKEAAFFTCWARKEAFIKAKGKGLSCPLDSFSVAVTPGEPPVLEYAQDCHEAAHWHIADIDVARGYASALAVFDQNPQVSCWETCRPLK